MHVSAVTPTGRSSRNALSPRRPSTHAADAAGRCGGGQVPRPCRPPNSMLWRRGSPDADPQALPSSPKMSRAMAMPAAMRPLSSACTAMSACTLAKISSRVFSESTSILPVEDPKTASRQAPLNNPLPTAHPYCCLSRLYKTRSLRGLPRRPGPSSPPRLRRAHGRRNGVGQYIHKRSHAAGHSHGRFGGHISLWVSPGSRK